MIREFRIKGFEIGREAGREIDNTIREKAKKEKGKEQPKVPLASDYLDLAATRCFCGGVSSRGVPTTASSVFVAPSSRPPSAVLVNAVPSRHNPPVPVALSEYTLLRNVPDAGSQG
jgi:hypothetical protein